MIRDGRSLGAITVARRVVRPFSDEQIALLETFADQAVIAIENVRLFTELQTSNRDLTTALDTQTATSDILRVISSSRTDVQPVFDAIVRSAVRLLQGHTGALTRIESDQLQLAAHVGADAAMTAAINATYPRPLDSAGAHIGAIRDRAPVSVTDISTDPRVSEGARAAARVGGYRSVATVPLLRRDNVLGTLVVTRQEPSAFADDEIALLQTFADQAVIAIENVRLFTELQEKNRALTEAHARVTESLDQQTASSEILSVISRSPSDIQPVFDAIVRSAVRLCDGLLGTVLRVEGDRLDLAAHYNVSPEGVQTYREHYPMSIGRETVAGNAILDRRVINVIDAQDDTTVPPRSVAMARAAGFRGVIAVPLLRDGEPIGLINVARRDPGPFSDREITLIQAFANQAVIAIENVRLFNETKEALERQTASSEILRVISTSPADVQPVFDAVVRNAARLCDASDVRLMLVAGDILHHAAAIGPLWRQVPVDLDIPIARGFVGGRAVVDRQLVHVRDLLAEPEEEFPVGREFAHRFGHRTIVAVPLLRDAIAVGVITVGRGEVRPFTESQVELLRTFADQAVIAIENARLFKELQEKNRALTEAHAHVTEALQQQTATSEILKVISSSPTDEKPVFDAIAQSSVRLCDAVFGLVAIFDGELLHLVSHEHVGTEGLRALADRYPMRLNRGHLAGRAILDRTVIHVADVTLDPDYVGAPGVGNRATLSVPMLRYGAPIGTITIGRFEPLPFTEQQIELLKTFADQAVIAIENVRLFKELEARTRDLTRSVSELRALGDVSRAISSTLDLQTVLTTIVSRAVELSNGSGGVIYEYDQLGTVFELRTAHRVDQEVMALQQSEPIRIGEGAVGRAVAIRAPVQISDLRETQHFSARARVRELLIARGYLSVLAVPLLVEDEILGALVVLRQEASELGDETVELMKTFATQSALAIQNARLFREIELKSRELEAASRHKSEFLANMSHELRTPLNAIIGFSEVLSERMFGELNEKQDEYLKDIHASGQHLLSLINDILDLSKIEAGRMELELTDFDLPTALDNALTLVRERAGRRGIALQMNVDSRLGQIQGDERKIRQVVLNLLSNAIKFTPEGGRIEVLAAPKDGSVEVSVADTGVGIAPGDQEAVFEEFRQVGTADKKVEGTGLGLTLCRKFIELHGGKIWVKSQIGEGSTFTFTVPVRRGE
jgi:GAF domain-containing protein